MNRPIGVGSPQDIGHGLQPPVMRLQKRTEGRARGRIGMERDKSEGGGCSGRRAL